MNAMKDMLNKIVNELDVWQGEYLEIEILPLSFEEYVNMKNLLNKPVKAKFKAEKFVIMKKRSMIASLNIAFIFKLLLFE